MTAEAVRLSPIRKGNFGTAHSEGTHDVILPCQPQVAENVQRCVLSVSFMLYTPTISAHFHMIDFATLGEEWSDLERNNKVLA